MKEAAAANPFALVGALLVELTLWELVRWPLLPKEYWPEPRGWLPEEGRKLLEGLPQPGETVRGVQGAFNTLYGIEWKHMDHPGYEPVDHH